MYLNCSCFFLAYLSKKVPQAAQIYFLYLCCCEVKWILNVFILTEGVNVKTRDLLHKMPLL